MTSEHTSGVLHDLVRLVNGAIWMDGVRTGVTAMLVLVVLALVAGHAMRGKQG